MIKIYITNTNDDEKIYVGKNIHEFLTDYQTEFFSDIDPNAEVTNFYEDEVCMFDDERTIFYKHRGCKFIVFVANVLCEYNNRMELVKAMFNYDKE